jgi:hypothetical protein
MFEKKVNSLMSQSVQLNQFLQEGLKQSSVVLSGNGAVKYSTSGNKFVDNFAAIANFKQPRTYQEVAKDMELLWSINPKDTVKLAIYIRIITRKSQVLTKDNKIETLEVQRGTGLKNEGIMRMLWLAINHPDTFKANIPLFIAAGSWKDIITMMNLDLQYHGWDNRKLDWNFLKKVIFAGLANDGTKNLVLKYLPTIRTNKNCTTLESQADTLIGRYLAKGIFNTEDKIKNYTQYRKLKASGNAHEWQQHISKQLYDSIKFDRIAGRALSLLVGSKFLENHNLVDRYTNWISSQPTAKYTGFVHELFNPLNISNGWKAKHIAPHKEATINAQFKQLVETGKQGVNANSKLLVVRDTSGSMMDTAKGCNISSYNIAKSLALYFSEFLTGPFANSFAEFAGTCKLHQWVGNTPCDKYVNDSVSCIGNTNFQSVINLFINIKHQGVEEKDFPTGIICVSDGEFDRCDNTSNFNTALRKLRKAGFSDEYVDNFKIILWDIPNEFYSKNIRPKFEDFATASNFFYLSGYDASIVSFILGGNKPEIKAPKNAEELFRVAMDQELLNRVTIVKPSLKKFKKNTKKKD